MRLIIVALAFLTMVSAALAAEQRAHPLPKIPQQSQQPQETYSNQQHLGADNRGTERAPFIVKAVPEEKSEYDIQREKEKSELDRKTVQLTGDLVSYTWLLFIATAVLAFVTGGLTFAAFYQMRDARKAIRAAENAAKAAERHATVAEQTFVDLERPYLFYEHIRMEDPITIDWCDIEPCHKVIEVFYDIKNYGRTPAIITDIASSVYIGQTFPERPSHNTNDIWNYEHILGTNGPDNVRGLKVFYSSTEVKSLNN
jgi:hypothetical protein